MKTLLVSLVSDQTLPSVQLIKEYKDVVDDYLFVSTEQMEKKGCRKWIEKAAQINKIPKVIEVKEFSFDDINSKLDSIDFSAYDRLIVNITGGTKVMLLAAENYFKQLGAEIYYVTGYNNEYIKLFPGRKKEIKVLSHNITLIEYLDAYGFTYTMSEPSGISPDYTKSIYNTYISQGFDDYNGALNLLRKWRNKGVKDISKHGDVIIDFIEFIGYAPKEENVLSSLEVKFLTGEWLEEYVGLCIKEELGLNDEQLQEGIVLNKELPQHKVNYVENLIGDAELIGSKPDNEIDVVFIYKNKFYTIECKTSIINRMATDRKDKEGNTIYKDQNILGETIYKTDYLKSRFGLFAQSRILTLTNISEYINNSADVVAKNNKTRNMADLINRCNISNIKLIDASMLLKGKTISEFIV